MYYIHVYLEINSILFFIPIHNIYRNTSQHWFEIIVIKSMATDAETNLYNMIDRLSEQIDINNQYRGVGGVMWDQ